MLNNEQNLITDNRKQKTENNKLNNLRINNDKIASLRSQ